MASYAIGGSSNGGGGGVSLGIPTGAKAATCRRSGSGKSPLLGCLLEVNVGSCIIIDSVENAATADCVSCGGHCTTARHFISRGIRACATTLSSKAYFRR